MRFVHQWLIGLLILLTFAILGVHLRSRERIDMGEGVILAQLQRMDREPASPDWIRKLPLTISAYGPVYYWFVQATSRLTGDAATFFPGRLLSYITGMISLLLIGLAVARRGGKTDGALFAALLFVASPVLISWLPLERVDMLALVFMLIAYLSARKSIVLAAVAIAAGALTRQSVAIDAIPIALYLWALFGRVRAIRFFALAFVLTLFLWALLVWQSDGYYLFALTATSAPLEPAKILRMLTYTLRSPTGVGAIIVAAILLVRNPIRTLASNLYLIGFVFHLLFDTVTGGKVGSNLNYLLPAFALGAILIGIDGVPLLMCGNRRSAAALATLSIIAALPAFDMTKHLFTIPHGEPKGYSSVVRILRSHPTPFIAADGPWMEVALKAGARPVINDPFLLTLLWNSGRIDRGQIISSFEDGRVGFVLLDRTPEEHIGYPEPFWPRQLLDTIRANYRLVHIEYRVTPVPQTLLVYAHKSIAPESLPRIPVN